MQAILYLRVSTDDQREFGASLQAQQKMCELEAKKQGITKKLVFSDVLSGKLSMWDRPGLTDALLALQQGDVFIVSHRDRLARDTQIMHDIRLVIRNTPATLVVVSEYARETKSSLLQSTLADIIAEHERDIIQTRTKNVLQELKAQNVCIGNVPFGYQLSADNKHIELSIIEQKIVEQVQRLRELNYTFTAIAQEITAMNFANRNGKPFGKTQLQRIMGATKTSILPDHKKQDLRTLVVLLAQQELSLDRITQEVGRNGHLTKKGNPLLRTQISRILKQANMTSKNLQGVPYGFEKLANGTLKEHSKEQELILLVHELSKKNYAPASILAHINNLGYTSRTGTPFRQIQIIRMLKKGDV